MMTSTIKCGTMIEEVKKPVDPEINGSARKAELQSIKQPATDAKDLLVEEFIDNEDDISGLIGLPLKKLQKILSNFNFK